MKPYTLILAIACLCIVYLGRQAPEKTTGAPSPLLTATPGLNTDLPGKSPNNQDLIMPNLGDSGYCGAKLPPNFSRPDLGVLLNQAPGVHGNKARQLYNNDQEMEEHLDNWETKEPQSAYPHVWRAYLELKKQDPAQALLHFQQAQKRLPNDPVLALFTSNILAHTIKLKSAIDMLKLYTQSYPGDLPKQQELARLQTQYEIQNRYQSIQHQGLTLIYPPEVEHLDWESFIQWMDEQLEAAAEFTGTPRRASLTIIAFEGKAELLATTCTPTWTGGVYDGSIKLALRNHDSLPQPTTVAHEILHAQLTNSLKRPIPAWFSEGMAQAFAHEEKYAQRSWKKMVKHQTYIPLSSLGDSFLEFTGSDDARLAYHQGLAMVLWIHELEDDDGIHRLVQMLQNSKSGSKDLMDEIQREFDASDFLEFVKTLVQD